MSLREIAAALVRKNPHFNDDSPFDFALNITEESDIIYIDTQIFLEDCLEIDPKGLDFNSKEEIEAVFNVALQRSYENLRAKMKKALG
jgi:hypothetical protein